MTGEIIRLSSISLSRWWWGWRKQVLSEYEGEDDNRLSWLPSLSIYVEAVDWLCGNSCWQCCLKGNKERIRMGGFNISFRGKNSVIRKGKVAKPKQVVVFRKCNCEVSPQQRSPPQKTASHGYVQQHRRNRNHRRPVVANVYPPVPQKCEEKQVDEDHRPCQGGCHPYNLSRGVFDSMSEEAGVCRAKKAKVI